MSTCAQILKASESLPSAKEFRSKMQALLDRAIQLRNTTITDSNRAAVLAELADIERKAGEEALQTRRDIFWAPWGPLDDLAREKNCTKAIALLDDMRVAWLNTTQVSSGAINTARIAQQEIKFQQQSSEAEAAATKTENAGNGTPGSAPSSATVAPETPAVTPPVVTQEPAITNAPAVSEPLPAPQKDTSGEFFKDESGNIQEVVVEGKRGVTLAKQNNRGNATQNDADNEKVDADWRVRLALAPGASYLYEANPPGILAPLRDTKGVIFPYTPQVQVQYAAAYDPQVITHSNYKTVQYQASSVDSVSLTCEFTAQDTFEANYLLATIHFFRSLTKMFYGQDENPRPGNPPPLCFLYGLGAYQFDEHPLVITNFNYILPNNVDYIRATVHVGSSPGTPQTGANPKGNSTVGEKRLEQSPIKITQGGKLPPPAYSNQGGTVIPTYVPTSIALTISGMPVVSRNAASNKFSLKDYANGRLLRGSTSSSKGFGGFW